MTTGAKFCFALIGLAAAAIGGWQAGAYFPPSEYQVAAWALFSAISLGAVGVAIS